LAGSAHKVVVRMRRGAAGTSLFVLVLIGAIAAGRWAVTAYERYRARPTVETVQPGQTCPLGVAKYPGPNVEVMGEEGAVIDALWVLPPHELTQDVLDSLEAVKQWVKAHPKLVHLTIAVLKTKEAEPVLKRYGQSCAGVTINGQSKFRLWDKAQGKFRDVPFEKAPGPYSYNGHDVIDLLEQYLENTGHLPRNRTLGQEQALAQPPGQRG